MGKQYVTDVLHMDPFEKIKDYEGEVLILHGDKDKIVNYSYSQRAYEAYLGYNPLGLADEKRVRLYRIEKGAHGFSKKHDIIAIATLREWLS